MPFINTREKRNTWYSCKILAEGKRKPRKRCVIIIQVHNMSQKPVLDL